MRTVVHLVLVVVVGVGIGLGLRNIRGRTTATETKSSDAAADGSSESVMPVDWDPNQPSDDEPTRLEPFPKPELEPGEDWLESFQLTERSGRTVSSEDLKGQPYVVSFFFSTCPSICVMQNQKLKELHDKFLGQKVRFLSITIDPKHDTPKQLTEYAARFGADPEQWLFLTGDFDYIRRVGSEIYQVHVDKEVHTERFILIDPKGEVDGLYTWRDKRSFQRLQTDIATMVAASSATKQDL